MLENADERALLHAGYAAVIAALDAQVAAEWSWPSAEGGFVMYLERVEEHATALEQSEKLATRLAERRSEAPVLAACGYAARAKTPSGLTAEEWKEGARRLSDYEAITPQRTTFLYRPHEVLGIALGIDTYEDEGSPLRRWLAKLIDDVTEVYASEPIWKRNLMAAAATVVGSPTRLVYPEPDDVVGIAYWLLLSKVTDLTPSEEELGRACTNLLRLTATNPAPRGAAQAAAVRVALDRVINRVLEAVVEEYVDPESQRLRAAERAQIASLEARVAHADRRARQWGEVYELALRLMLLPITLLTAGLVLLGFYLPLVDNEYIPDYGQYPPLLMVATVALGGYYYWAKVLDSGWARRFGAWNANRLRKRWLGRQDSAMSEQVP